MDKLNIIISTLKNIVSSEIYSNVLESIEVLIAIITIYTAKEKVDYIIEEYKKKKIDAIYGYYVNFKNHIKRISMLINDAAGKPMKSLYMLSPCNELTNQSNGYEKMAKELSDGADEFIKFLLSVRDQVPPADNDRRRRETWEKNIEKLLIHLNQLKLIDSGIHLPALLDEEGVIEYCTELNCLLQNIKDEIDEEINHYYQERESD